MVKPLLLAAFALMASVARAEPPKDWRPALTQARDGTPVLTLHAVRCALKELEPGGVPYAAESAEECAQINRATAELRKPTMRRLRLKAGAYIVQVFNSEVPWAVDFALKGAQDESLPETAGALIAPGQGVQYRIKLLPGVYSFGSPKNPTPDYTLLVER